MRKSFYAWGLLALACSSEAADRAEGSSFDSTASTTGGPTTTIDITTVGTGGTGGSSIVMVPVVVDAASGRDANEIITTLPPGFTGMETQGGWKLGGPLGEGSDAGGSTTDPGAGLNCGNILRAVVRDFKGRNETGGVPDFEGPLYGNGITVGLVAATLGADQKPVYASQCEEGHPMPAPICPYQAETTTQANFDQWYRYTPGTNKPYILEMWFAPQGNGLFRFQSSVFFPLDNNGWGNTPGNSRNFSFTTELHTTFAYKGGDTFRFEGDDDVWVFINGRLAVDLGGLHPKAAFMLSLDTMATQLGIVAGSSYSLDLFHAERHTPESNFLIETNLAFVNCGTIPPDVR